jgi:PAS domain S-box-containing protein
MPKKKQAADILYQNLVENMNEGVWVGDKAERTVYANPKFCEMVGYDLKEILGWESYVFWDEKSAKRVRRANQEDRKKGKASSYEGILVKKGGEQVPVLLSGAPLPSGGTIGIMTDLTQLKKEESARHILASAVDHSSEAMIVLDTDGSVLIWNRGARLIFGYKAEARIGKTLEDILSEHDLDMLSSFKEEFLQFTTEGKHKSGEAIALDITLSKQEGRLLLIARDISSHKRFENELSMKYQKLKDAYNHYGIVQRQMDYVFDLVKQFEDSEVDSFFLNYVVSATLMLSKADACVLRLYKENKGSLDLAASSGVPMEWAGKASIPFKGSLAEKAFQQNTAQRVIDIAQEKLYRSAHLAKGAGFTSLLILPLKTHDKKIGTLSLYVRADKKIGLFENEFIEHYAALVSHLLGCREA